MSELTRRAINPRFALGTQERTLAWRLHIDVPLLVGALMVCCLGLFVLYSASGEDMDSVIRQVIRLGIGFTAMLIIAQIPPRTFRYWALPAFAVVTVLLVLEVAPPMPSICFW